MLREQIETVTRERTAALEPVEPGCGDTRKSELEAGRKGEREGVGTLSREWESAQEPDPGNAREPKNMERDFRL